MIDYTGPSARDFYEWRIAMEWGVDLERWYTLNIAARAAMIATWMGVRKAESAEHEVTRRESEVKQRGNSARNR